MDIRIQHANNPDPKRFNELFSFPIIFQRPRLKVTIPIQFNAEFDLDREKIDHKRSDAILPAELAAKQLPPLEPRPEDDLGVGHGPTQLSPLTRLVFAVKELVQAIISA